MITIKEYKSRIKNVVASLRSVSSKAILVLGSTKSPSRSGDQQYPFEQSKNLYYLTGLDVPDIGLYLDANGSGSVYSKKQSKLEKVWDGEKPSFKNFVTSLGFEYEECECIKTSLLQRCKGSSVVFYQSEPNTLGREIAESLFKLILPAKREYPHTFTDADKLIAPFREIKSPAEIKLIKEAIDITALGIHELINQLPAKPTEVELARIFESEIIGYGSRLAFNTIAAYGANAAELHHSPRERKGKKGELLLLDLGATRNYYCGDISRTYPIDGKMASPVRDAYDAVLEANKSAISGVKAGRTKKDINSIALKELVYGLKYLGLVSGKIQGIIKNGSYREFYPHSLGHSLGLDTHDVGELREKPESIYKTGMVVTIEPGLYLRKSRNGVPPFGIRIEDNVVVTKNGCSVLSSEIPKERNDIENWVTGD